MMIGPAPKLEGETDLELVISVIGIFRIFINDLFRAPL